MKRKKILDHSFGSDVKVEGHVDPNDPTTMSCEITIPVRRKYIELSFVMDKDGNVEMDEKIDRNMTYAERLSLENDR